MTSIRVFLADDQRNVRYALRMLLQIQDDICVVGEAADGAGALAGVEQLQPDVMVIDFEMPGMNGLEVLCALQSAGSRTAVVMLSLHDEESLKQAAAAAGAHAFVTKHEPTNILLSAIRSAAAS